MLQIIITTTLLITGLFASKEQKSQPALSKSNDCLQTTCQVQPKEKMATYDCSWFNKHSKLKNENERETI